MRPDAVLLLNLGSPASADVPAVRAYLREFLGDPHVIPLPTLFRKILLETVILPFRAKKSAARYAKILTPDGAFPLVAETEKLRRRVAEELGGNVRVFCAMRYGEPSMENAAREMLAAGTRSVFVMPLYPQRAESSWDTAVEHAEKVFSETAPEIGLRFAEPFFDAPGYIAALAESAENFLRGKDVDKLLVSFHGVPVKTRRARTYRAECVKTGELLADALRLPRERREIVFQSRFGRGKWLEPSLENRLRELPEEGARRVAVIAPGFIADCLETLEEIALLGRETFLAAGGKEFFCVPCLNDSPALARFLAETALRCDFPA